MGECMEVIVLEDGTGEIVNTSKNGVYCLESVSDSCIGTLVAVWTYDYWQATAHRVVVQTPLRAS